MVRCGPNSSVTQERKISRVEFVPAMDFDSSCLLRFPRRTLSSHARIRPTRIPSGCFTKEYSLRFDEKPIGLGSGRGAFDERPLAQEERQGLAESLHACCAIECCGPG